MIEMLTDWLWSNGMPSFGKVFREEALWLYLTVMFTCAIKYIPGAVLSFGLKHFWEIFLCCSIGSILGSVFFAYAGTAVRKVIEQWLKNRKRKKVVPFAKKRKLVLRRQRINWLWDKYGLYGIAAITPLMSTPLGVSIAISFDEPPRKIIRYMAVSMIIWSLAIASMRDPIMNLFKFIGLLP